MDQEKTISEEKERRLPYLPRFPYDQCIKKLAEFNRFSERPCPPRVFASQGLGVKSTGTVRTMFACLNKLGWLTKTSRGLYDTSDLGRKIARSHELGVKDEEIRLARETLSKVDTLQKMANYIRIKKALILEDLENYVAKAWGTHYNFNPKYLKTITRYMISFLEAAKEIEYDFKEKKYRYIKSQPGEVKEALRAEVRISEKEPAGLEEIEPSTLRIRGVPIRLDIQVSDKTDIEELKKKIRTIKDLLKEELST